MKLYVKNKNKKHFPFKHFYKALKFVKNKKKIAHADKSVSGSAAL